LEKNAEKTLKIYFFHFFGKTALDIFGHFLGKCALFSEISRFFGEKRYYTIVAKNIFKKRRNFEQKRTVCSLKMSNALF
jgi:hypothetical protein